CIAEAVERVAEPHVLGEDAKDAEREHPQRKVKIQNLVLSNVFLLQPALGRGEAERSTATRGGSERWGFSTGCDRDRRGTRLGRRCLLPGLEVETALRADRDPS